MIEAEFSLLFKTICLTNKKKLYITSQATIPYKKHDRKTGGNVNKAIIHQETIKYSIYSKIVHIYHIHVSKQTYSYNNGNDIEYDIMT